MIEHEIIETLDRFRESFDTRDWDQMQGCLCDELFVDYSSFRGTKEKLKKSAYVALRQNGLHGLETNHRYLNFRVTSNAESATCECDFVIERFSMERTDYFHTYGKYFFELTKESGSWKILKITQSVDKNDGNRNIHGAFSKKN